MRDYIYERVIKEGLFIAETGATIRQTAKIFHLGKSTVHKDVTVFLPDYNRGLFLSVREVLDKNLAERHIRGGEATRRKCLLKAEKDRVFSVDKS